MLTTVLCVVIGYPAAYFIGRALEKIRNSLLMLVMVPFWTSFLIRTYAWITILEQGRAAQRIPCSGRSARAD